MNRSQLSRTMNRIKSESYLSSYSEERLWERLNYWTGRLDSESDLAQARITEIKKEIARRENQ